MDVNANMSVSGPDGLEVDPVEWIGTSLHGAEDMPAFRDEDQLAGLIQYRASQVAEIARAPYDPDPLIQLSGVDGILGFSEVAVGSAYKAILMIQMGREMHPNDFAIRGQQSCVRAAVGRRLNDPSLAELDYELEVMHLDAYSMLCEGLRACSALWDGLVEVKAALKLFPNTLHLLDLQHVLKQDLLARTRATISHTNQQSRRIMNITRCGRIFIRRYPWLDKSLFSRGSEFVDKINSDLKTGFGTSNCEVRPVAFDKSSLTPAVSVSTSGGQRIEDVGALGMFATKDFKSGELVLLEKTMIVSSNINPKERLTCDACHAALGFPWIISSNIVHPTCCKDIAFCSQECHDMAMSKYHPAVCGKDWDWLYDAKSGDSSQSDALFVRNPLFLRTMAIILTDMRREEEAKSKGGSTITNMHPLLHPIMVRLTASYGTGGGRLMDEPTDWYYFNSIKAPYRILATLGVDICTADWAAPEVLQTLLWRLENNISINKACTSLFRPRDRTPSEFFRQLMSPATDWTRDPATRVPVISLHPTYAFLNHGCAPNLSWRSTAPNIWSSATWLDGSDSLALGLDARTHLRPGAATIACNAQCHIPPGAELRISYVGDALGANGYDQTDRRSKRQDLAKWFPNGCGCRVCEQENALAAQMAALNLSSQADDDTKNDNDHEHTHTETQAAFSSHHDEHAHGETQDAPSSSRDNAAIQDSTKL